MIGERCQLQRHTNTAPRTRAITNEPMVAALAQPQSCPLTTPSTSAAIASPKIPAPAISGIRRRPGARLSTSQRRASSTAAIPIGRLTRNTSRQLPAATRRPPSDGPSPAAAAPTADSRATPCERCSAGNALRTSASEEGTRNAAPRAWTTRKAISSSADGATAHNTDAAVNNSSPKMNARRRPMRSAIRPAATRNAANTMLYAFRTQDSDEIDVPGNERPMLGNAMLTIVASMNATAAPSDAIASTTRGSGPRRRRGSSSASAAIVSTAVSPFTVMLAMPPPLISSVH